MKILSIAIISAAIFTAESIKLQTAQTHVSHKTLAKASLTHNSKSWEINDQECGYPDNSCWMVWFGKNLNCQKDDEKCWSKVNAKFTCSLSDPTCWNDKIPNFPCAVQETICLKMLLPQKAPCKFGQDCWKQ